MAGEKLTPDQQKCPVCGETDPYPKWFCLYRHAGVAEKDKPCSYSLEGHERLSASLEKQMSNPAGRRALEDSSHE